MRRTHVALRAQKGVTILQYVIGAVVGISLTVVLLLVTSGQRGEAEIAANQQFIVASVPSALQSIYYSGNRSFTTALGTVATAAQQNLIDRGGLQAALNDGSTWTMNSLAAQSVTIDYGCEGLRATSQCTQLARNINAVGAQMIGTAGATAVVTGCPTAGANCRVRVVYIRPR